MCMWPNKRPTSLVLETGIRPIFGRKVESSDFEILMVLDGYKPLLSIFEDWGPHSMVVLVAQS